jgi:hypothetical protein
VNRLSFAISGIDGRVRFSYSSRDASLSSINQLAKRYFFNLTGYDRSFAVADPELAYHQNLHWFFDSLERYRDITLTGQVANFLNPSVAMDQLFKRECLLGVGQYGRVSLWQMPTGHRFTAKELYDDYAPGLHEFRMGYSATSFLRHGFGVN